MDGKPCAECSGKASHAVRRPGKHPADARAYSEVELSLSVALTGRGDRGLGRCVNGDHL